MTQTQIKKSTKAIFWIFENFQISNTTFQKKTFRFRKIEENHLGNNKIMRHYRTQSRPGKSHTPTFFANKSRKNALEPPVLLVIRQTHLITTVSHSFHQRNLEWWDASTKPTERISLSEFSIPRASPSTKALIAF